MRGVHYLCLVVLITFSKVHSQSYSPHSSCKTPDNKNGTCQLVKNCDHSVQLLQNLNTANREYLQKSQCLRDAQSQVWVCCPNGESLVSRVQLNLLPSPPECGFSADNRIFGGVETEIDEYPWLAQIGYQKPRSEISYHCGGSLINERYVITAAHCTERTPSTWRLAQVKLGEYDTTTNPDCKLDDDGIRVCNNPHVISKIEEKIVHSGYLSNNKNQHNDIALLRLATKIKFTQFIKPICLPVENNVKSRNWNNIVLMVSGWGKTENSSASTRKLKVNLTADANSDCQRIYNKLQKLTIVNSQICAGGDPGKDSCNGDSGGPLMGDVNSRFPYTVLVGVVSYGPKNCGTKDVPGVYTRVSEYMDWIQEHVRQ